MGDRKPGNDPLADMLVHGEHPFPTDMEEMLRKILKLDPMFPDGTRRQVDRAAWGKWFFNWQRGMDLDEGRRALRQVLDDLEHKP